MILTDFDFRPTQGWPMAFWLIWPEMALRVLWCLNELRPVNLDVSTTPRRKYNILKFSRFGTQIEADKIRYLHLVLKKKKLFLFLSLLVNDCILMYNFVYLSFFNTIWTHIWSFFFLYTLAPFILKSLSSSLSNENLLIPSLFPTFFFLFSSFSLFI